MFGMTRRKLQSLVDAERVRQAIEDAEKKTSGEIRVTVSRFFWGNVRKVAERAFDRLGMSATAERNGVLVFIVPSRRTFVVLGDSGIHERVGQDFWDRVAGAISKKFREADFTGGLVDGIGAIGESLSKYFPANAAANPNELADEVDFGAE